MENSNSNNNKFPDDFLFGVATAAYQIEGGQEDKGKGENMWDYHLHLNPSIISDSTNGDIACDSYNKYNEDVELLDNLGVNVYRFSISWARILPTGYPNKINPNGLRYYNNLINGLIEKNIVPMVTMYHFDMPKPLQDLGGWTNTVVVELFVDFARILFDNFGDRVKFWITFNLYWMGYGDAEWPPFLDQPGIAEYLFFKNTVLAHGKVYRLYQQQFKEFQGGQIGLAIDGRWYQAESESQKDQETAERVRQFCMGCVLNPIAGDGGFPDMVIDRIDKLSKEEGFPRSRLPEFPQSEINIVKGSFNFIGLNVYTTYIVKDVEDDPNAEPSLMEKDIRAALSQNPSWPQGRSEWLKVEPSGLRKLLNWIKTTYGNPPIFITENGYSDGGELEDFERINYLRLHLAVLLEAIHEDKVPVKGYILWSLMDNFEWLDGYSAKFGLYHVDFADPSRKRTPKLSAKWYSDVIKRKQLDFQN